MKTELSWGPASRVDLAEVLGKAEWTVTAFGDGERESVVIRARDGRREDEQRFEVVFAREVETVDDMAAVDGVQPIDKLPRTWLRTLEFKCNDEDILWLINHFPFIDVHVHGARREQVRMELVPGSWAAICDLEYIAALYTMLFDQDQLRAVCAGKCKKEHVSE